MKKLMLGTLFLTLLLGVSSFLYGEITNITNYNLSAYPGTDFAQCDINVYFINTSNQICFMNKTHWNGSVIQPSNSAIKLANPECGIIWTNNKLFYVSNDNRIYYLTKNLSNQWILAGPYSVTANSMTDIAESTNNLFFVDASNQVRSMSKSTLTSSVINTNAPLAKPGTDLLWKGDRLYYVTQNNQIYYFYWTSENGWQFYGNVGNQVHPSSNLTASSSNLYFVDINNQVRSMGIGNVGEWWYNHVIDNNAPLAASGSDLKWIDNKLFYISNNNTVCYLVWERINSWEYCAFFQSFVQDVVPLNDTAFKYAEIYTNSNFFEASNKQVLFVENEGSRIYYFRAPLNLQVVNNPISKTGWNPVLNLSDEFNTTTLNTTKWDLRYPYYNHPMDSNEFGESFSLYYNEEDQSNHITSTSTLKLRTEYGSFSEACYLNEADINDATNGGTYDFKSAMLHSKDTNSITHGFFEIQCKVPNTQKEKFCFWLYTGGQEIDVFETTGIGNCMPTNYHEFYSDEDYNRGDEFLICCLKNQHLYDNFYTYAVEWDNEKIIWYLNNQIVRTVHKDQNYPALDWPSNPLSVLVTTRVWDKYNTEPFNFPNDYEINYIRVYQRVISKELTAETSVESEVGIQDDEIYPNPSSNGFFNVDLKRQSILNVFDLNGKLLYEADVDQGENTVDLSFLGNGVFILKISNSNNSYFKRVIITK